MPVSVLGVGVGVLDAQREAPEEAEPSPSDARDPVSRLVHPVHGSMACGRSLNGQRR